MLFNHWNTNFRSALNWEFFNVVWVVSYIVNNDDLWGYLGFNYLQVSCDNELLSINLNKIPFCNELVSKVKWQIDYQREISFMTFPEH